MLLPSLPLCLEYFYTTTTNTTRSEANGEQDNKEETKDGNAVPSIKRQNFVAVGMMGPGIEIWNLDTIDSVFPDLILGAPPAVKEMAEGRIEEKNSSKKKKSKKCKKKKKQIEMMEQDEATEEIPVDRHTDAILSLSWNTHYPHLLASSSADHTIKIWDLSSATPQNAALNFASVHHDKISSVEWEPMEGMVLLSGDYSGMCAITDAQDGGVMVKWDCNDETGDSQMGNIEREEVECVKWDPLVQGRLMVC